MGGDGAGGRDGGRAGEVGETRGKEGVGGTEEDTARDPTGATLGEELDNKAG